MSPDPNEFRKPTKDALAKRAGYICTNPDCRMITSRPHKEDSKAIILGEAAHIKGARDSARYDSSMLPEERRHINNGIWLCCTCHKLIDSDEEKYTTEILYEWKRQHEEWILNGKINSSIKKNSSTVPFMCPLLPDRFVERPELFEKILIYILEMDRKKPVALTTAIHGAGGYGKTTLAIALCHHPKIKEIFTDGILWVTIGIKPKLLESLATLYFAVTGERTGFKDIDEASENLALALANKNCLLVVDDVWESTDLKPFLRGGPNCVRLLTTRNFELACEGKHIEVDQMVPDEAVKLLAGQQDDKITDWQPFYALGEHLGEWPLLLELAGKVLHYRIECGDTLENAIQHLNIVYKQKGIMAFDAKNATERNQAVAKTIAVSLDLLDTSERQHYMELAIFPEDTDVPFATISQLWGLSLYETEEMLKSFNNLALLKLNFGKRIIHFHDEMLFYLRSKMTNPSTFHAILLTVWGDPYNLPDDYAWRFFFYHLKHANQLERMRQLILDPRWLKIKLVYTGTSGLLNDIDNFSDERAIWYIHRAIQLSIHILAKDPTQFLSQFYGRLIGVNNKIIRDMIEKMKIEEQSMPWLRPLFPFMESPDRPVIFTLTGHSHWIRGVVVTPDGKRLVSASVDKTLKVWDLKTGKEISTLTGHSSGVNGVAVTPDGTRLISASVDKTLKVWDIETGKEERTLTGHLGIVNGVAVSSDGKRVVSASDDETLKVWDLEMGQEVSTLIGHSDVVNGVAVTPDGKRVVSSSNDETLKVWDLESGQEVRTLIGHSDVVNGVAVTPDGKRVVSASNDETIKVWDLETGQEVRTFTGHLFFVKGVAVTPDGKHVVSASTDETIIVWDIETGELISTLAGHTDSVTGVTLTPDGKRVVSASNDETIKVWDLKIGIKESTLSCLPGKICAVKITPDGKQAVSTSNHTLKVWDLETGQQVRTLTGHLGEVTGVSVTPDGKQIVSSSDDRTVKIWDLETGQEVSTITGHSSGVNGVAVTPDGKWVLSSSHNANILKAWDLETEQEVSTLIGHLSRVNGVTVTSDGKHIVSSYHANILKVWNLETGQKVSSLTRLGWLKGVTVIPDGKRVVSTSNDNTLKVWDLETGKKVNTLTGHSGVVNGVAVILDGKRIVSASNDKTLKIWDLETGKEVSTLTGHSGGVNGV